MSAPVSTSAFTETGIKSVRPGLLSSISAKTYPIIPCLKDRTAGARILSVARIGY